MDESSPDKSPQKAFMQLQVKSWPCLSFPFLGFPLSGVEAIQITPALGNGFL